MKTMYVSFAALMLFSTASFAGKEHCVTRNIVANYVNGSVQSTQCFSSDNGSQASTPDKCKHDYKR